MLGTRQPVSHTQQNNTRKVTSQRLLDCSSHTPCFRLEDCKNRKEKKEEVETALLMVETKNEGSLIALLMVETKS